MTFGKCFANRKAVPDDKPGIIFFDRENWNTSCRRALFYFFRRGVASKRNEILFERHADGAKRHVRPQAPTRPILRADSQRIACLHAGTLRRRDVLRTTGKRPINSPAILLKGPSMHASFAKSARGAIPL